MLTALILSLTRFYLIQTISINTEKVICWRVGGYSVKDSQYLKDIIEEQGLKKYINGDYQLGLLDKHGQRISIRVEIPNKTHGGTVSFVTGWMVRANGQITLNTPYGGK